jgi:hypothetical protein
MARRKDDSSRWCPKGCGRAIVIVVVLILIAAAGGILLWQLLPDNQKENVEAIAGNIAIPGTGSDAPQPSYIFNQCADQGDCCNGLSNICDMRVSDILYAGVHNGQSSVEDGYYIAPNHQYNVLSALDYGYRVINLDIGRCSGVLSLVHGVCKLGTTDPVKMFQGIMNWLDANPTEIVIIPIQFDNAAGGSDEPAIDLAEVYNLLNQIQGFTNRMYEKEADSAFDDWPTLRELIESDKRILLFHYNGPQCVDASVYCPPGFHDWFQFAAETKFEFQDATSFENKTEACTITRGRQIAPFYALNLFTTIPNRQLATDLINTRSFLQEHIAACSQVTNGLDVNILFMDFWDVGEVPRVVQQHNRQLQPPSSETEGETTEDSGNTNGER